MPLHGPSSRLHIYRPKVTRAPKATVSKGVDSGTVPCEHNPEHGEVRTQKECPLLRASELRHCKFLGDTSVMRGGE